MKKGCDGGSNPPRAIPLRFEKLVKMKLEELFKENKPIIGMIHLAGKSRDEKVTRALEELAIYEQEEVSGAIIEDYHGSPENVQEVLEKSRGIFGKIVRGVNLLSNPYLGFKLAQDYGAGFVQFDSVQTPNLNLKLYNLMKREFPNIAVLGGVGFKYIPQTGNPLEIDLKEGQSRCEAIVTTGDGTGIETPVDKLRRYKELLGKFPLIVGAGVNLVNTYEQLMIVDGAIIGSYFKPNGNTQLPIERSNIQNIMKIAKQVRKIQS